MVQSVNAALRSSKASKETSLSSAFLRRPSTTLSRAVSVLLFFLYADCLISSRLSSDRHYCSCVKTTFCRILEMKDRFDTDQKNSSHLDPVQISLTEGLLQPV